MFANYCKSVLIILVVSALDSTVKQIVTNTTTNSGTTLSETIFNCWKNNECVIRGKLTRNTVTFPVNIDCNISDHFSIVRDPFKRFSNIANVTLSGCDVNRFDTFGTEYIPDSLSVRVLTLEKFKTTEATERIHFKQLIHLESLMLRNNSIERLCSDAFDDLTELRSLTLYSNNLQYLHSSLFEPLEYLENLTIVEPMLNLKFLTFFQNLTNVLISTKTLWWSPKWPDTLRTLNIYNTQIVFDDETRNWFSFDDLDELKQLHLTNDNLTNFPQIVSNSLKVLNFSGNHFKNLETNEMDNLTVFDISANFFREVGSELLTMMPSLRQFIAHNNEIQFIAEDAFSSNNALSIIDLRGNQLRTIDCNVSHICPPVRIVIDDNPWSCAWIMDIVTIRPEFFEKFLFQQNTDNTNVRGLKCILYPINQMPPYDENFYRRNPKDTAILTLIILAIGVTVLFFLLYLHIKCRRYNRTPFYRAISPTSTFKMSDRSDIIRKRILPATDYEAPINVSRLSVRDNSDNKLTDIYEEIPDKLVDNIDDDDNKETI